jgi:Transposase IS116/IS110/IS902 family
MTARVRVAGILSHAPVSRALKTGGHCHLEGHERRPDGRLRDGPSPHGGPLVAVAMLEPGLQGGDQRLASAISWASAGLGGVVFKKIDRVFRENETCQRIAKIKGVGPKTATAIVAAIGDRSEFKNERHLAAWAGLVPRQFSSGDRKVVMGISKRGNQHLRSLLVHGARAVRSI